jgi:hypothetical protein
MLALIRDSQYARAGPAIPPPMMRTFKGAMWFNYVVCLMERRIKMLSISDRGMLQE